MITNKINETTVVASFELTNGPIIFLFLSSKTSGITVKGSCKHNST